MTSENSIKFAIRSKETPAAARPLVLFNSLGGRKEKFVPLNMPDVKMYVCGLTPYDTAHMGHVVPALRFDLLRNYLEYKNFKVNFVQNVTDIDDKIINRARETGEDPGNLTRRVTDKFYEQMKYMHLRAPDRIIKVTETIPQIISYISELIEKGAAYSTAQGNVYFEVAKKKDYGKLSNQKVSELQEGVRIESESDKKAPADFALWKKDESSSLSSDSPWGRGRPGWHIECSVMIDAALGTPIDIHGGGLDLKFPHHENEIAQSEAHDDHDFAKYWMHAGLLTIEGTKMSKSLGNFLTIEDAFKRYGAELIRYVFLVHHYRSNVNLSDQVFSENLNGLFDFYKLIEFAEEKFGNLENSEQSESVLELLKQFEEALNDDLNSPVAVVALRKAASHLRVQLEQGAAEAAPLARAIKQVGHVLGLFHFSLQEMLEQGLQFQAYKKGSVAPKIDEIRDLLIKRHEARENKNFAVADQIRGRLSEFGLEYLDAKSKGNAPRNLLLNLRFVG